MDLHLSGGVALVAGSSRGIGKAIARAFLAEGCRTAISGRRPDSLAQTASEFTQEFGPGRVLAIEGDLTRFDVIQQTLGKIRTLWGRIDCLVANIGHGRGKLGWDLRDADWFSSFETNLWGSIRLVTEALGEMTQAQAGSIVLIASITGVESTSAPLAYSAAKAALVNYGKNLGRLVGPHQVRINCVAPGNILFPGGAWERRLAEHHEAIKRYITDNVPLQRFGRPEEIADLVVFLSSDRASFITGACIVADGGQTRSL
ncbi:MAG: SDR family oxidoreductase [Candidatus Aminicenantales bacterium]